MLSGDARLRRDVARLNVNRAVFRSPGVDRWAADDEEVKTMTYRPGDDDGPDQRQKDEKQRAKNEREQLKKDREAQRNKLRKDRIAQAEKPSQY